MEKDMQKLIEKKEELLRQLQEIQNNITKEDLEQATNEELLEYMKLSLEIKKAIIEIEAMENNI